MVKQARQSRGGSRRPQRFKISQVLAVHSDDVREAMKIAALHLPCAQVRYVETVLPGGRLGARIGRMADVPVARAGAVDVDSKSCVGSQLPEHAIGQRRAADVA
jgi:hypothetical protein